ncbi:Rha family transcriptional regulator [Paraburkholderia tropica]|uniref:Rha family transcriptional regulator n=1 Tax=Paraburkholderia tropica TaxID=92647 RepID=UPI002AB05BA7|nr:Rha family transcriptional regulator [Paraburkholderia tropica]
MYQVSKPRNTEVVATNPADLMMPMMSSKSMSSLEIAELLGMTDRHDDVRRSIERLANGGTITLPPLAEVSNPRSGPKTIKVYVFSGAQGKRDSIVVVARLSPEHTAALVDRWQFLEDKAATGSVPLPGEGPEMPTEIVVPAIAPNASNQFDFLQGMLDQIRASEARISRVEQAQATNTAAVAELRDDIPLLVSNGQARAVVSEPSHGVESMNKISDHWNKKAGVPQWVTEYVLRQSKRFRIVATENIGRGIRRHADGTPVIGPSGEPIMCPSYPGYQTGAATRMMTLFFRECERHATDKRKATHPDLPDRPFNLSHGYPRDESR